MMAMSRAVDGLQVPPEYALVDGNRLPEWSLRSRAIVQGDRRVACISAASIVAKVARDADMVSLAERYPGYGFERHKGYPTAAHRAALERLGVTPEHRRTFKPVARFCD